MKFTPEAAPAGVSNEAESEKIQKVQKKFYLSYLTALMLKVIAQFKLVEKHLS